MRGIAISEETREKILNDLDSCLYTRKQIANRYNVSVASIYNIMSSTKTSNNQKKSVSFSKNSDTVSYDIIEINNEKVTVYNVSNQDVEVGLIKDRHRMPVSQYIFNDEIKASDMFNYKMYDEICSNFIKKNLLDKNKNLVVYVTGLTCAVASVIKNCSKFGINLSLKHFNNSTGKYNTQVIFSEFNQDNNRIQSIFPEANQDIILYNGLNESKITNTKELFVVKYINKEDVTDKVSYNVFTNLSDAYEMFYSSLREISKMNNEKVAIYLESGYYNPVSKRFNKQKLLTRIHNY